jgi:hypothetical protein
MITLFKSAKILDFVVTSEKKFLKFSFTKSNSPGKKINCKKIPFFSLLATPLHYEDLLVPSNQVAS